jgi:hypothetical protein
MSGPRITIQLLHPLYNAGADRIEMDISYQFVKIYILLAHNGFVTVLIKISMSLMAAIEIDGIAGEDFPHQIAERPFACTYQNVQVIF